MDSLDEVDTILEIRTDNYLHLIAVVFLLWDHILTLASEVRFFWAKWRTRAAILFFTNRYFAAATCIWVVVSVFAKDLSAAGCKRYYLYRQSQLVITQAFICILLTLRTYALYERSRVVLCVILVAGLGLAAASCSSLVGQTSSPSSLPEPGCHVALSRETSIRLAVPWEALVAFDTLIFSLTLYKTWRTRRDQETRMPLISMILRDGAIYYGVMALSNTMNILTFYFLGPYLRGGLSTFASSISVTMMSRLMLNLRQSAMRDFVHPSSSETIPLTTLQLTSMRFAERLNQAVDYAAR